MNRYKDITNQRFGSLVAIRYHHSGVNHNNPKHKGLAYWVYKCDCGKEHIARANTVTYATKKSTAKNIPSCGCVELANKTKHGYRTVKNTHPLYRVYRGMMSRCYLETDPNYKYYGARGVTVCKEWKGKPVEFIKWGLSNGWKRGLTIDKDILCEKLNIYPQIYSPLTCIFILQNKNTAFSRGRTRKGINSRLILDVDKCQDLYKKYLKHQYPSTNQFNIAMSKEYNCSIGAITKAIKWCKNNIKLNELNEHKG